MRFTIRGEFFGAFGIGAESSKRDVVVIWDSDIETNRRHLDLAVTDPWVIGCLDLLTDSYYDASFDPGPVRSWDDPQFAVAMILACFPRYWTIEPTPPWWGPPRKWREGDPIH